MSSSVHCLKVSEYLEKDLHTCICMYNVFGLITAPALISAPPLTFYFIFTYYRLPDDLFPDFLL